MRILHLPVNIASQISITVRALRDMGMEAKGLVLDNAPIQDATGVRVFSSVSRRQPFHWLSANVRLTTVVLREIYRSDVIHWHFAEPALPREFDLKWAKWLGKPGIVTFWGSDIRIPEYEARDNPYYARLGLDYEYRAVEGRELSYRRQERFARHGVCACIALKSFERFLKPGLFKQTYWHFGALNIFDFQPAYPAANNSRPVLAHAPTVKVGKGTSAVLAAIEVLKQRYDFEFRLVDRIPRPQALDIIRMCDVFLDQFVEGNIYGLAGVEAMALGKPVVCYIKPSAVSLFPPELPIINANQENLAEKIEPLLQSAQLRHNIGVRSRLYVEKYHDAHKYAHWLVGIYQELIDQRKRRA